jgi:hypothetical protein
VDPDPGSGAFLTRDPGWVKKTGSGSEIQIWEEQPRSYFRELRNQFFGLILKLFDADQRWRNFGYGIGMAKNSDPG